MVETAEYTDLVKGISGDMGRQDLLHMIRQWRHMPTKRRLERLKRQAERLSTKLGKKVQVEIDARRTRIPEGFLQDFWPSLVHVVRNAVDHGIESAEERVLAGKPRQGRVKVSAALGDEFSIRIEDDGRGINWTKIRARAERQGLTINSQDDLIEALFTAGLTTRDEVTETSRPRHRHDGRPRPVRAVRGPHSSSHELRSGLELRLSISRPERRIHAGPQHRIVTRRHPRPGRGAANARRIRRMAIVPTIVGSTHGTTRH